MSRPVKKRLLRLLVTAAVLVGLMIWIWCGNVSLKVTEYAVAHPNLPEDFDGFVVLQLSDLHNAEFGKEQEDLLAAAEEVGPDIIVITGDLIDSRNTDVPLAVDTVEKLLTIAPVYYVTGNHEGRLPEEYTLLEEGLSRAGAAVLHDEAVTLERRGAEMTLLGVDDPRFRSRGSVTSALQKLVEEDGFTLVLSHRPELFEEYCQVGADLVFAGHAHGGQLRIPLIGGVFAPDQGLFPKYTQGVHTQGDTVMVVSRGLGNSLFPFRVNNPPELVAVTLKAE